MPSNETICTIMENASAVLGMNLCFHDRLGLSRLPKSWIMHACKACEDVKITKLSQCVEYDSNIVHSLLSENPEPQILQCHAGFTQIVVGVKHNGLLAGVLFAGPCWIGKHSPSPELNIVDKHWLEQRASVLHAVAIRISSMLKHHDKMPDRREEILTYLYSSFKEKVTLENLAVRLHLSESHTSHLMKKIFNETLPQLINRLKMQEAARLLTSTDWPIGEIAWQVGFDDQNYFSRLFKQIMKKTPRTYRKLHYKSV